MICLKCPLYKKRVLAITFKRLEGDIMRGWGRGRVVGERVAGVLEVIGGGKVV